MEVVSRLLKISYNKLIAILSPVFRSIENIMFRLDPKGSLPPSPIFIIGAPRTGSTILYQVLSNSYQISYVDNFSCAWHRNLRFGLWLSYKKYGDSPHNNFTAVHGSTLRFGGHAPSECGQFWYRWLSKERHFIDHKEVTSKMVADIRKEVMGISQYLKRPVLFKNLNAGQRLRLIKRTFPNAKIIYIRRDPRFVVRSILRARQKVGVRSDQWWSIKPPNFTELITLTEHQMCAAQVYYIERQIDQDLALFPDENIRTIHYQNLDEVMIRNLADWLGVVPKLSAEMPVFKKDNPDEISGQEWDRLIHAVNQYPFDKELFV